MSRVLHSVKLNGCQGVKGQVEEGEASAAWRAVPGTPTLHKAVKPCSQAICLLLAGWGVQQLEEAIKVDCRDALVLGLARGVRVVGMSRWRGRCRPWASQVQ